MVQLALQSDLRLVQLRDLKLGRYKLLQQQQQQQQPGMCCAC
jgi:hypothetical protein